MNYRPLIIIGAGRSGTNMLRDLLCLVPNIATWPCDEINYIWRHGNVRKPTDELSIADARPAVRKYIRAQFDKMAKQSGAQYLVEKTCANSLRVDFVEQIVPEAKYIFIVRHGVDVVASAMKRWKAELDIPYLLAKARYVPVTDLPYYATKYFGNRLYRVFSGKQRLAYWGPKFEGFETFIQDHSIEQICGKQWQECVEQSQAVLSTLPKDRVHFVRYEDFVSSPAEELARLFEFIESGAQFPDIDTSHIRNKSVGLGEKQLGEETAQALASMLETTLEQFGYSKR